MFWISQASSVKALSACRRLQPVDHESGKAEAALIRHIDLQVTAPNNRSRGKPIRPASFSPESEHCGGRDSLRGCSYLSDVLFARRNIASPAASRVTSVIFGLAKLHGSAAAADQESGARDDHPPTGKRPGSLAMLIYVADLSHGSRENQQGGRRLSPPNRFTSSTLVAPRPVIASASSPASGTMSVAAKARRLTRTMSGAAGVA